MNLATLSIERIVFYVGVVVAAIILLILLYRLLPKRLKVPKFDKKWKDLQSLCRDKANWGEAIKRADRLLDEALKRRKYSGVSMGERLMAAQKKFTDHDSVWAAHSLYKKIDSDPELKLKEAEVKQALFAYRQALRDMGALEGGENAKA